MALPRVALVTGAAARIGRAIMLDLCANGWVGALHYNRSEAAAAGVVREIEAAGGKAAMFQADLSDAEQMRAMFAACTEQLGAPLCLINNASLFEDDSLQTLTVESWAAHMSTNLQAPVFLAQTFAAALPDGAEGNIINIIDQRVLRPTPEFFSYSASKAALWAVTQSMAQALAPHIRVNAIGPGPVLQSIHQSPEDFEREWRSTILRRGVDVAEIAAAVRFILATPSLTGQMIALDGGQHLS